jgi:hypothetical protein
MVAVNDKKIYAIILNLCFLSVKKSNQLSKITFRDANLFENLFK